MRYFKFLTKNITKRHLRHYNRLLGTQYRLTYRLEDNVLHKLFDVIDEFVDKELLTSYSEIRSFYTISLGRIESDDIDESIKLALEDQTRKLFDLLGGNIDFKSGSFSFIE